MSVRKFLRQILSAGCMSALLLGTTVGIQADDALTIGSDAPALDVEHWVQDGNGKFKPVTKFDKGKVYVVEFWATWCGPCVASMPHLVEVQKKFADKNVQIVSISDEDLDTVEKFLERDFPGAKKSEDAPKTFRELTSSYCLTADPDRSSYESYMEAAGQNGIPCAFIVGKDQKIEWIGHPMSMDEALGKVVDGSWDRIAFAEEFKAQQELDILMSKIFRAGSPEKSLEQIDAAIEKYDSAKIQDRLKMLRVQVLAQAGKIDEAMTAIETLIAEAKSGDMKKQLKFTQFQLMMKEPTNKKFAPLVEELYKEFDDQPQLVNMVAWTVYEAFEAGTLTDKALIKPSRAAAEKAAKAADATSKAAILDTAAHLQHLDGDTKAALKTQKEAVELADDALRADLEKFLEELTQANK
jgi:thiol-disulfide isomerase/thioredoxin